MANTTGDEHLNDRQLDFCKEYIVDHNGTKAAIRAGYSEHTADVQSCELLRKPKIINKIAELRGAILNKAEYGAEQLLQEYKNLAHANISDFIKEGAVVDDDGTVTMEVEHFRRLPREITAAVNKVKTNKRQGTIEFTLYDKVKAMEGLGKHFGIFEEHNKQKSESNVDLNKLDAKELKIFLLLYNKAAK